jgi:hypothetical protein
MGAMVYYLILMMATFYTAFSTDTVDTYMIEKVSLKIPKT